MSADEKEPDLFDDEKIVVEAEDEAPKSTEKAESKANFDELSPEDGIKQLKERLETEKRAREEAERRTYEAQQQVQKAQRDVQDGDYQLIVSAIDTTRRNADILKNSYAEAMSVGDYRKAADIHEAISLNSSKLTTLENGKNALEQKLKQPVQPVQPPANNPVEVLASQLTPRSAAWVRAHPEVVKDHRSYQRMIGAHNMAMADGHAPDSDSYFEAVESVLGLRKAPEPEPHEDEEVVSVAAQATQKRSSAPPPTPSSKVSSSNSGKPNTVRLTSEQREMASMMGMKPEDYAKNMVALKREGKLN
jgi:hypothetical protein